VQFDTWDPELRQARRHRPVEERRAENRLQLQQSVLDVVEELDGQRDRPPVSRDRFHEARPQDEQADQHDERVGVVEHFRRDHPGVEVPEDAARVGHGPAEGVDLKRLGEVLGPVGQHNHHEEPEGDLVRLRIQPLEERCVSAGREHGRMCRLHVGVPVARATSG
jgi:hypothetical protein